MNHYKENPLLFINTFLRREGEERISEEQFKEIAAQTKDVYSLKWQVAVRRKFFGCEPVNQA